MDRDVWFRAISMNNVEFVQEYCERYKCTKNDDGDTGLILATRSNYIEIVQILVEAEAGLTGRDKRTALLIAAEHGLPEACRILAPREHTIIDPEGRTALIIALERRNIGTIQALAPFFGRETDKNGRTALSYAVAGDNPEATNFLLDTLKYTIEDVTAEIAVAEEKGFKDVRNILQRYLDNTAFLTASGRIGGPHTGTDGVSVASSAGAPNLLTDFDGVNAMHGNVRPSDPEHTARDGYLDFVNPSEEGAAVLTRPETFQPHKASARLDSWLDTTMKNLGTFASEHKKIVADYKDINTRHNDLLTILRDVKSAIGYQSNELDRDLIDYIYKMQNSLVQLQNQNRDATKTIRIQETELAQLRSLKLRLEGTNTASVEVESLLKKTLDAREADYKSLQERFRECQSRLLKAEDKAKEVTTENATLQHTISELKAEKESIKTILDETDAEKRRLQEKLIVEEKEIAQLRQNVRKLDAAGTLSPTRKPLSGSATDADAGTGANASATATAPVAAPVTGNTPSTPGKSDSKGSTEKVSERTAEELEKIQTKMLELKEYEARLRTDKIKMREEAVEIRKEIEATQEETLRYKNEAKELRERLVIMTRSVRGSGVDDGKSYFEQQAIKIKSLEDENDTLRTELAYFQALKNNGPAGELTVELANTRAAMQTMQDQLNSLKAEKALSDKYIQELLARGSTGSLMGTNTLGSAGSRPGSAGASNSTLKQYLQRELEPEQRSADMNAGISINRTTSGRRSGASAMSSSSGVGASSHNSASLANDYKVGKSLKLSILKSHMNMNTMLGEKSSVYTDVSSAAIRSRAGSSGAPNTQYGGFGF